MAVLEIKYLATSIKMQMRATLFLPEAGFLPDGGAIGKLKVLWLLHGEGGDGSDWLRLSMVEHHARRAGIALVMPTLDNSMCMDMVHGGYPYFTYLSQDLPRHLRNLVRVLSDDPADNAVAGISSGGYGAVKWLLRSPGAFAAAACLSGDVDMVSALRDRSDALTDDWRAAFGDHGRIAGTDDDLLHLGRQRVASGRPVGPIHLAWSAREDAAARRRRAAVELTDLGLSVTVREEPADQGWPFWDACVRDFIDMAFHRSGTAEPREDRR